MSGAAHDGARTARAEWEALVGTAVLGTDRRAAPPAADGWDAWDVADDPAVALLDRAAAVVVARRAGVMPRPSRSIPAPAPEDARPPCPAPVAARLTRILRGEHDVLLAEWFVLVAAAGVQLPWELLPHLLLRGRRDPSLDTTVRSVAGDRVAWLADVVPELGVSASTPKATLEAVPLQPPSPPADSGATVAALVDACAADAATWAAAPELRRLVASIDPAWLPSLIAGLSALPFRVPTERTRAELLSLAEFRHAMLVEFRSAAGPGAS